MTHRRLAAAVGLVILVAGILAAAVSWVTLRDVRQDEARGTAAADARYVRARITERVAAAVAIAGAEPARITASIPALIANGSRALILADRDGTVISRPIGVVGPAVGGDLHRDPLIGPLLPRAVDRGGQAGGPVRVGGDPAVVVVAARFAGPAPSGAIARRRAAVGYVVAYDDVEIGATGLGHRLIGPDGRSIAVGDADKAGGLLRRQFSAGGGAWETAYADPPGPPLTSPVALLLGAILLAALGAATADQLDRRRARAAARAELRDRQLVMIERVGAQLQQTLDLGELLPTVAVAMSEDYGFGLVDISLADEHGRLVEAFRLGERLDVPEGAEEGLVLAGRRVRLPLRRGWRTVGVIEVRTERRLDAVERTALNALTDLLAVAVTNAQLLQRERESAVRLRELDTIKNAFLGTVSHELRTAMTAITGFGEILTERWDAFDDARRRDIAGRIRNNATALKHLVDDLLDFARLEQQRVVVNPRQVDLGEIVGHLRESLTQMVGDRTLTVEAPTAVPAWVDPFAVERILANLLSNAGKYAPVGSAVTVRVSAENGHARLVVDDEGPGIPPEDRDRIFTRFYRREDEVTMATKGAGIGLTILADFAAGSAARVSVGDSPAGGARFVVDFPSRRPPGADDAATTRPSTRMEAST